MDYKEMINEKDAVISMINRMFITDNFSELCALHEDACKRLEKLFDANYERIKESIKED